MLVNRNVVSGVPLRSLMQQLWMLKMYKAHAYQTHNSVVFDIKSGLELSQHCSASRAVPCREQRMVCASLILLK